VLLNLDSAWTVSLDEADEMSNELEVGPVDELPPGTVTGVGRYAVGNADGELFAVTRRCRHLFADLADGTIDGDGCLTCPWHGAKYDVATGRMKRGPQGIYRKIPGLGIALKTWTTLLPLGLGKVTERDATLYVE
jgi:nitrite reductase/ring-hydroxylating ferredoxin subunit